jgi:hypothetical protein
MVVVGTAHNRTVGISSRESQQIRTPIAIPCGLYMAAKPVSFHIFRAARARRAEKPAERRDVSPMQGFEGGNR